MEAELLILLDKKVDIDMLLSVFRELAYRVVTKLYPWFLKRAYGMDLGKGVVISRSAKMDRAINPRGIHIGEGTWILTEAMVLSHDHCRELKIDTYVGRNCIVGVRSIIMPGVTIGDSCVIAACSVVTKKVPSNCIVAGNPARVIKTGIIVKNGKIVEPGRSIKIETE